MIGGHPPQPQPSDRTTDSVDPGDAPTATVPTKPQQRKGFLECYRDAAAPDEVRYTVTVLIAYSETDDCASAARSLATEDRLDLENYAVRALEVISLSGSTPVSLLVPPERYADARRDPEELGVRVRDACLRESPFRPSGETAKREGVARRTPVREAGLRRLRGCV